MPEHLDAPFLPNYELAPDGSVPLNIDKMRKTLTKMALQKMKKPPKPPRADRRKHRKEKWY
jgi:hypothetical protein